jgi:hypothetical protein
MYRCSRCGSDIDDGFDRCWNCNESVPGATGTLEAEPTTFAAFRTFRGILSSWESLFSQAAAFATSLGPDRVISISHSADHSDGVVTVWYWDSGDPSRDGELSILDPG